MYASDTEISQFVNFNISGFAVKRETTQQNRKYPSGRISFEVLLSKSPKLELFELNNQSCSSSRHIVCRIDKMPVMIAYVEKAANKRRLVRNDCSMFPILYKCLDEGFMYGILRFVIVNDIQRVFLVMEMMRSIQLADCPVWVIRAT